MIKAPPATASKTEAWDTLTIRAASTDPIISVNGLGTCDAVKDYKCNEEAGRSPHKSPQPTRVEDRFVHFSPPYVHKIT